MTTIAATPVWDKLLAEAERMKGVHLRDLLSDPTRSAVGNTDRFSNLAHAKQTSSY